ncbi:class I adenylate-forming enzyme family protein [Clostridium felsineum]|uniref:class I adenylate-forming enzyme family protein n=1 Tax=Clostridium felsineum TaxID=36839 RepID=UPI00098C2EAB|nr:AMP-binding protein [Clostridium felsineum]URZ17232.1 Long-chain-fatty-acid--CoA ligase [Clostridium felsineum DSM 794]
MNIISDSIGSYIDNAFDKFKNKEALIYVDDERHYTYEELKIKVDMVAYNLISISIKKGDHVALFSYNSPEWMIVFLAVLKIGAVLVCLNYASTEEELDYLLKKSDSTILITSNEDTIEKINFDKFTYINTIIQMDSLFNLDNIMPQYKNKVSKDEFLSVTDSVLGNNIAMIINTSGTTGKPKLAIFSHSAILNGVLSYAENYSYTSKDKILDALPLHHILGGNYTAFLGLLIGCTVVLIKNFKTSVVLETIQNKRCTGFHGVPTMYQYLLSKCDLYDLSSLRVGMITGAVASQTLIKSIMENMHIREICYTFGQTETLGVTQTIIYNKNSPKLSTVGKPVKHVEVKVCDQITGERIPVNKKGEIYVKSPYCMTGYYNNALATRETIIDGWVRTGDIGFIDNDGYLSIKGRLKDVIVRGGENIFPMDIEINLIKHPKIENAIVVGIPDETLGEEVFIFIKVKKYCMLTKEEVLNFLSGRISKYKFPKYIEFIDTFPLTSTGKIKRSMLKQIAIERTILNKVY